VKRTAIPNRSNHRRRGNGRREGVMPGEVIEPVAVLVSSLAGTAVGQSRQAVLSPGMIHFYVVFVERESDVERVPRRAGSNPKRPFCKRRCASRSANLSGVSGQGADVDANLDRLARTRFATRTTHSRQVRGPTRTTALAERPFRIDPGPAWNALDVGFSLNEHNVEVESSPATELLASIGLQRFRPVMNKDRDGFRKKYYLHLA